ncbi:hypothetical protein SIID45300_01184 [Candidatus Magnetaquicoccaceae bacterium FCR-1]|uniref:Uncharacterized protein n=1 Tax=Candidatus Magnetaquiglobus chichijimensis TaxID=3141448 RepID=A0ABQ0C7K7_9PROT
MPGAREPRESPTGIALPGIGKSEPEARPPEGRRPQPPEGTRGSEGKSLPLPGIGKGEPEARPPEGRRHQPPEGTRGSEGKSLQPSEGERGSEGKSLQPSSGERPGGKIPRGPEGGRGPEGKGAGDRPNRDGHQPEATGTAIPGIGKPEAESRPGEGKRLRQPETGRMPDGATPRSHATPGGAEFKGTGVPESRGHEPVRERRGDRDRAAPTPASSLQVTPQTAVIPQKDHAGWTLKHHRDDGAEVRVRAHALPDGRRQVTAYQNFKDPETGRRTRVYQDGRRVIHGADFVTRSAPGRPTLTIHDNGLREAYLPNKKRFFEEKFATRRDQRGHEHRIIHRTVHARFTSGRIVMLPQPVIWTYAVVPVRQVEVYLYDPQPFQPTVYTLFTDPLPSPIEVTPSCIICPPPLVSYHDTIEVYRNPLELLIDWLLAGAVDDGYTSIAPVSASYDDPQVNQLNATVASLRQELTDVSASNQALRHELEDQRIRLDLLEESPDPAREMERAPLPVPEPVRKQFSKQVKQDLLDHQEKRPLSLAQILDSREPEAYIFQVSETLEATEIGSNEECALSTGDLVRFDQVPEEGQPAARVRVITSKASSCPANSVVNVSLWDLQEMLNSYRQRLEATMEKVQQEVQPSQTR